MFKISQSAIKIADIAPVMGEPDKDIDKDTEFLVGPLISVIVKI